LGGNTARVSFHFYGSVAKLKTVEQKKKKKTVEQKWKIPTCLRIGKSQSH
jgi:hypothetical protein